MKREKFMMESPCPKCGRTEDALHSVLRRGRNACGPCYRENTNARYKIRSAEGTLVEKKFNPERKRARMAAYTRRSDVAKRNAERMRRRHRSPAERHKFEARYAVSRALKSGRLSRLPCEVCDDPRSQGHHPDYSKPLDVKWLCRKHHEAAHRASRASRGRK